MYTSEELAFFVKTSGMKHIKSAPHHPDTNGCAARAVTTFKSTMKKLKDIESMSDGLRTILFQYCITLTSVIGKSPAELLMNRKLNKKLNLIKPDADSSDVSHPKNSQRFEIEEKVWVQNFNLGEMDSRQYCSYNRSCFISSPNRNRTSTKTCRPFKKEEKY